MAKITLENGVIVEGTIEELTELAKAFGEKMPEYVKVEGREPKVGDYVKFTDRGRAFLRREYYEIVDIDFNDDPQIKDDDGDEYDCYGRKYDVYEKATKDAPEPKLENLGAVKARKGDFVKFHENHRRTIAGKFYEVVDDSDRYMAKDGFTRYTTSGWGGNSKRDVYRVRATDEEVEKAKLDAKFAKIGRKPGEFKKGDIVRVLEDEAYESYHKAGDIGEITAFVGQAFRVKTARISTVNWVRAKHVELIAPVESRVDVD